VVLAILVRVNRANLPRAALVAHSRVKCLVAPVVAECLPVLSLAHWAV
jgi:hypothetical protein